MVFHSGISTSSVYIYQKSIRVSPTSYSVRWYLFNALKHMAWKQVEVSYASEGPQSPCGRQGYKEGQGTNNANIQELWCCTSGVGEELPLYLMWVENRLNILAPKEFHLKAVPWQTEIGEYSQIFRNG